MGKRDKNGLYTVPVEIFVAMQLISVYKDYLSSLIFASVGFLKAAFELIRVLLFFSAPNLHFVRSFPSSRIEPALPISITLLKTLTSALDLEQTWQLHQLSPSTSLQSQKCYDSSSELMLLKYNIGVTTTVPVPFSHFQSWPASAIKLPLLRLCTTKENTSLRNHAAGTPSATKAQLMSGACFLAEVFRDISINNLRIFSYM